MLGYESPFLRSILLNQFDQKDVFLLSPGFLLPYFTKIITFYGIRIVRVDLFPSGHAVDILATDEIARYFLPIYVLRAFSHQ